MSNRQSTAALLLAITLLLIQPAGPASADIIGLEDFDGGDINLSASTNVFDYGAGGGSQGSVFGRVSSAATGGTGGPFDVWDDTLTGNSDGGAPFPTDDIAVAGRNSSAFFAMNDMDSINGPGLSEATWSFDISSAISLSSIEIDIGAFGNFESSSTDGFRIEARIDGSGWDEIFRGRTNESISQTYRPFDNGAVFSLDDPLEIFVDGSATAAGVLDKSNPDSGLFDTWTSVLLAGSSGNQLDIRLSWIGTPSGDEPMGFDNIQINGVVPEPGTAGLTLIGLAGWLLTGRRRRC